MVRVIDEEKKIQCKNCKTNLVYTCEDIRTAFFTHDAYVECPVCGNKIFINFN